MDRYFSFDLADGSEFCGVMLVDSGTRCVLEVGGERFRLLWSERWGPSVCDGHGDPLDKQPGPRHAFWRAASLWNRQGRRMDGLRAVWHEPKPQILQKIGRYRRGWEIRVVQEGEDPDYSATVWLEGPADTDASSPAAGRAGNLAGDDPLPPTPSGEGEP